MDTLFILSLNAYLPPSLLTINAVSGFGLAVFLFLFCFLVVHLFILLKLGWNARNQIQEIAPTTAKEEKKTPEPKEKEREPIYYIVERKRTRPKQKYGEPKEFRFK